MGEDKCEAELRDIGVLLPVFGDGNAFACAGFGPPAATPVREKTGDGVRGKSSWMRRDELGLGEGY